MKHIISEVVEVDYSGHYNPIEIEEKLKAAYSNIIRWAVISIRGLKVKVSVTYEQDVKENYRPQH